jgi:hypothetical protein
VLRCWLVVACTSCSLAFPLDDYESGAATGAGGATSGGPTTVTSSTGSTVASSTGAGAAGGSDGGAPTSYQDEVLADQPVAYYRLGETVFQTAVDASGNGLDGVYFGAVTSTAGAIAGDAAVHVDQVCPSGDVPGGVRLMDTSLLNFEGNAPFTIEAWIRPTCIDNIHRRIVEKAELGTPKLGYSFYINDVSGLVFFRWGSTGDDWVSFPGTPNLNQWNHVVAVYGNGQIQIFHNGVGSDAKPATETLASTTAAFRVGTGSNTNFAFAGDIDEVAIYDKALPLARILVHRDKGMSSR